MKEPHYAQQGALFSACKRHRYLLWREWDLGERTVLWVMCNPSTADQDVLDPTLRRCLRYSRDWGYGGMWVANVFALRSTDPQGLHKFEFPTGRDNDAYLMHAAASCDLVMVGWGVHGSFLGRGEAASKILAKEAVLYCLGVNKDGTPKHPLYLRADAGRELYRPRTEIDDD